MDKFIPLTSSHGLEQNSNDDFHRVKILCSYNGSILPRPQDGRLRYVGGETRILSVARGIGFEQLMARMKEFFEGASVLKYKQPDEDLDALVSVVNDDDVTNMMEEYDKLDGFTQGRLRVFLFSNSDPLHFLDVNGRDNETRYFDALNASPEFGKQHMSEFHMDDVHFMEGNIHNQQNFEMSMTPVNMHHLTTSHLQHPHTLSQRYNEMEPPHSPAYHSPRHPGNEFSTSPSCSYYNSPYGEPRDRIVDRPPSEDYYRQHHHANYIDHQSQLPDNVPWLESASIHGEKTGFSNSIPYRTNIFQGNNVCDHCISKKQTPEFSHPFYSREKNDSRPFYSEVHERGWMLPHQVNTHEEHGSHNLGSRSSDQYIVDGNGIGPMLYPGNHHMPSPYVHHDDRSQYIYPRHEFSNELIHDQTMARYGNFPYAYGLENIHHASSNELVPVNSFWRDVQSPMHVSPSNETSISPQQENSSSTLFKTTLDNSIPRLQSEVASQDPLVESTPKLTGYDGVDIPDYYHVRPLKLMPNNYNLEDHQISPQLVQSTTNMISRSKPHISPTFVDGRVLSPKVIQNNNGIESSMKIEGKNGSERKGSMESEKVVGSNCLHDEQVTKDANFHEDNPSHPPEHGELQGEHLSYIPQFVESVKKAALESAEDVKEEAKEGVSATEKVMKLKEETTHELDVVDAPEDLELDSDTGTESNSKIEPTKAEEEAIAKGLQTIKNDDLEEIRQLGSGTYGAVYHGKWKGSDVAIKRIKASCFAGKPYERERMIADFWKEALMLSSLHHPNVVSFYGIVRDGPDGSLATVTEYMINGSLKQFLKKKDRTIDRRKRLIIAMDTAFGMEYLHGKNIVHFDLKCENLLVNMRDPHRPICKIGDLGLSKVKQQTMVSGGVRGTLPWMAPELLSGKSHMVTEKIDVYSFGVVMWELLTGDEPYTNMHCASIIGGIVNNSLRPTIPTWCDPEWKSLMESCWSADPQERPSFLEISQKLRTMAASINVK